MIFSQRENWYTTLKTPDTNNPRDLITP